MPLISYSFLQIIWDLFCERRDTDREREKREREKELSTELPFVEAKKTKKGTQLEGVYHEMYQRRVWAKSDDSELSQNLVHSMYLAAQRIDFHLLCGNGEQDDDASMVELLDFTRCNSVIVRAVLKEVRTYRQPTEEEKALAKLVLEVNTVYYHIHPLLILTLLSQAIMTHRLDAGIFKFMEGSNRISACGGSQHMELMLTHVLKFSDEYRAAALKVSLEPINSLQLRNIFHLALDADKNMALVYLKHCSGLCYFAQIFQTALLLSHGGFQEGNNPQKPLCLITLKRTQSLLTHKRTLSLLITLSLAAYESLSVNIS